MIVARGERRRALVVSVEEDRRAILAADVPTLAVACRGVVGRPERREQVVVGDPGRVVLDLDRFGVTRAPAADLLVGWVVGVGAPAPHGCTRDAGQGPEGGLHSPEASGGEGGCLCLHLTPLDICSVVR